MRRLIAGNWKMNGGSEADGGGLARALRSALPAEPAAEVLVCPPFTALSAVAMALRGSSIALGAQDCYWEPKGAFTGEISVPMLASFGCSYVIVGHSERRHLLGETDEMVARKAQAVLANGLQPIICVGETAEERSRGETERRIETQVRAAFDGIAPADRPRCVVAYEPVWAIGSGTPASPADARQVAEEIRRLVGTDTRVLYGGSVNASNARSFLTEGACDGALVGGASLDAASFAGIVSACR